MKPSADGVLGKLNAPAPFLSWCGTLSGFQHCFLRLAGTVFLLLLPAAQIVVQVGIPPVIV